MKAIRFDRTKPLHTYLVGPAVGPIEVVEAGRGEGSQTSVRIINAEGGGVGAKFAAETTSRALEWLENYLAVPFVSSNLDLVANPGCSSGAMEHPGLIIFCGPQQVTLSEQDSSRQRDFTRVVSHELDHQWFGNLVILAWLDDLWLSDGFANCSKENTFKRCIRSGTFGQKNSATVLPPCRLNKQATCASTQPHSELRYSAMEN